MRQFNVWHYLTHRLPKPREMRVQAKENGWHLMIKRWNQVDPSVPNDVCVNFFGEVRGKSFTDEYSRAQQVINEAQLTMQRVKHNVNILPAKLRSDETDVS